MKRNYCTGFSDTFKSVDISQCCKNHDNECGMRGTYNPFTPNIHFYKCLKQKDISFAWRSIITLGGILGFIIKMPYLYYNKYKYRKYGE